MNGRSALTSLLILSAGCSDLAPGEQTAELNTTLINCETSELGVAPLSNSCGLGWVGPFGDEDGTGSDSEPIQADPDPNFVGASPAFAAAQITYTVELPGNAGTGAVKFVAGSSQDYSVVTDAEVSVIVRDSAGTAVSPLLEQGIEAFCDAAADAFPDPLDGTPMVQVGVYHLLAGATYVITFANSSEDELHVTLDEPNLFMNAYYPDTDGDGFGNYRSAPKITECSAPPGYAGNGDDCDDANGSVFPGAPEVAGAGDNNCDSVPDGDRVATDLAIRDVTVLGGPTELAMGGPGGRIEVSYRYVNRGPALMDALVTTRGVGDGLVVRPGESSFVASDLMPVRIEELVKKYKVKCPKPKHRSHHHAEDQSAVRTLTFTAEIQPADAADLDTLPSNNIGEATLDVNCVDCSKYERCGSDHSDRGHERWLRRVPKVCRMRGHDHDGHDHDGHDHDGHDHDGHGGHDHDGHGH